MATLIQTWLDLALQQMAAESYLDQFLLGARSLTEVLINGNNNEDIIPVDRFDGYTRFVDLASLPNASEITGSVQEFAGRYQIVDHHANDATGFSATLMKDLSDPNDKTSTLSFRSVEYEKQVDGGDWERGGLPGTAGAIAGTGY